MKLHSGLLGALTVAGGIALIFAASQLRTIRGQEFGSAFFPTVLGVCLLITGILLFWQGRGSKQSLLTLPDWLWTLRGLQAFGVIFAAVIFILAAEVVGFLLMSSIALALLMMVLGAPWHHALLASPAASIVLHLVFARLLKVPLPHGVIERLVS